MSNTSNKGRVYVSYCVNVKAIDESKREFYSSFNYDRLPNDLADDVIKQDAQFISHHTFDCKGALEFEATITGGGTTHTITWKEDESNVEEG